MMLAGGAGTERMMRPRVHRKAAMAEGRPGRRAVRVVASSLASDPAALAGISGRSSTSGPPQRGVLILPGLGNNAADYTKLADLLQDKGMAVQVAQIERIDWSRNAAALTNADWWQGKLKPRPAVDWYLTRVNAAMQELKRRVDGAPITVLTHSAGGWLGRVYLLDWGVQGVDRFVSLGSPHQPPPQGVVDQTRGILNWVADACPDNHHPSVDYVTIAGKFVQGVDPVKGQGTALARFAGAGYQQVCGRADVWGDLIVPLPSAHLGGGTLNLDLEGVFHSPLGETLPGLGPWYGSPSVLPKWAHHLDGSAPAPEAVDPKAAAAAAAARATAASAV